MTQNRGSVRMGPISIFTLIVLLSLAVLGVLTIATAQASYASAEKQVSFTTDTYQNEIAGNDLVALVDEELTKARSNGADRASALSSLTKKLPDNASIENNAIHAEFIEESGRTLTIVLEVTNGVKYSIAQWKTSTQWVLDDSKTVWSGE